MTIVLPQIRIHPHYAVLYSEYLKDDGSKFNRMPNGFQTKKRVVQRNLSIPARKKLTKAITYMAHITPEKEAINPRYNSKFKFRLSFVTLTLSSRQQHPDTVIKSELLEPFIDWLKKVWHVSFYVWKAERQGNLNLHFHIIVDKFVHYSAIQRRWNVLQDKLGYIQRYWSQPQKIDSTPTLLNDYYNVNSTDIHSTRKVRNLVKYVCKYMIKDQPSHRQRKKRSLDMYKPTFDLVQPHVSDGAKTFLRQVTGIGRIWGCSHNLCNLSGASDFFDSKYFEELEMLEKSGLCYVKNEQYFKYVQLDYNTLLVLKCVNVLKLLDTYLKDTFPEYAAPPYATRLAS